MEEEHIRPPDEIIRGRLIHDDYYAERRPISEEDQISQLITQSEIDYEFQLAMEESERDEALRQISEYRKTHFAGLKQKFAQFQKIDKTNAEFYKTALSHITDYESGITTRVEVDLAFYNKFVDTLGNMRAPPDETSRILEFIVLGN
jgi:hypothetical protein